ncbi:retron Ec48 family effector membrane protein [Shewanella litorisediminis]|uniref:Retron Ec48 family effector membrane protein n=1 Tax=Shewanella litorisediminis TaxID=1173586 RepID=A0ABX7G1J9_9GAMM|nr:retron Ec48 family effector membrane protein [Shewanella litorisediminis]MCL2918356.1 retron Ec48 family effector membrane protein [Shewanella litorisediminis]QRH01196.1 retron Ec48 family effector membrane protein [Shewanella litorisediminis]
MLAQEFIETNRDIFLKWIIYVYLGVMFVLILSLLAGVHNDNSLVFEPCFTEKCFKIFGEKFKVTLSLIQLTTQFFLGVLTAFGVILAIFSYFNSKESSNFNIHLANMAFFGNSLEQLVSQREYISYSSVNKNVLYNLIFPNSKKRKCCRF